MTDATQWSQNKRDFDPVEDGLELAAALGRLERRARECILSGHAAQILQEFDEAYFLFFVTCMYLGCELDGYGDAIKYIDEAVITAESGDTNSLVSFVSLACAGQLDAMRKKLLEVVDKFSKTPRQRRCNEQEKEVARESKVETAGGEAAGG